MWSQSIDGFLSAVACGADEDGTLNKLGRYISNTHLCVRARVKADLVPFVEFLTEDWDEPATIQFSLTSDYPYRVIVKKELYAEYAFHQVMGIGYDNFKSAVSRKVGHERSSIYHRIHSAGIELEKLDPDLEQAKKNRADKLAAWYASPEGKAELAKRRAAYATTATGGQGYPWARHGTQTATQPAPGGTAAGSPLSGVLTAGELDAVDDALAKSYPTLQAILENQRAAREAAAADTATVAPHVGDDVYAREHGAGAWWSDCDAGAQARADDDQALTDEQEIIDALEARADLLHGMIQSVEERGRGQGKAAKKARREARRLRKELRAVERDLDTLLFEPTRQEEETGELPAPVHDPRAF